MPRELPGWAAGRARTDSAGPGLAADRPREAAVAPAVRLGSLLEGGLAPAVLAIVERGVRLRPAQARTLGIEVELAIADGYPPVRIVFEEHAVLVEDGAASPDLRIHGALPDLIHLMVSPALGGVPAPINARGRAALVMVARRRVRVEGGIGLMRRFLGIVRI